MLRKILISTILAFTIAILPISSSLAEEASNEQQATTQPNEQQQATQTTPAQNEQQTNTEQASQPQQTEPAPEAAQAKPEPQAEQPQPKTEEPKKEETQAQPEQAAQPKEEKPVQPVKAEPKTAKVEGKFKPTFQIFFNWHYYNDSEADVTTNAFQITRTQFGGIYKFGDFKAVFIVGVGTGTTLTANVGGNTGQVTGNANWLAFLKRGFVEWRPVKSLKLGAGIIGDEIKTRSEKHAWKHRFITQAFLEQRKFFPSGDQGFSLRYYFPKKYGDITAAVYAGEGFKKKDTYKGKMYELATTIVPVPDSEALKGMRIHLGFAYNQMDDDVYKMLGGGILSFEHKYVDIGAEAWWMKFKGAAAVGSFYAMHKTNFAAAMSYIKKQTSNEMTAIGFSIPATFKYGEHAELFVRYDYWDSLDFSFKDDAGEEHQDYEALLIAGLGWKFNKYFRVALDYWHDWFVVTKTINKDDGSTSLKVDYHQSNTVFLHLEAKY